MFITWVMSGQGRTCDDCDTYEILLTHASNSFKSTMEAAMYR